MQVDQLETIPIPVGLLYGGAQRLYAELYRRGAAQSEREWITCTTADLARSIGYTRNNVNQAITTLIRLGYLIVVRHEQAGRGRHPAPMFRLATGTSASAAAARGEQSA